MADVLLVDRFDQPIGSMEKLAAHRDGGQLHRAFSVFIHDDQGRQLLQLRSAAKYHFGGLWTNACCGHPPDGDVAAAAGLRLRQEFGFTVPLTTLFSFRYSAVDPRSDLTEREFDHVLVGVYNGTPQPDPAEIDAFRWIDPPTLAAELTAAPDAFTPWFRIAAPRVWSAQQARRRGSPGP